MESEANKLVVTSIAKGATAQLREVLEHADRDTVRPIYQELVRIAHHLACKHEFVVRGKKEAVSQR
jgi:hypothetical protein